MIAVLFLLLAFVCFLLAAIGVAVRRVNLIALGLAFWVLVPLLDAVPH
jgi:hypothetical protein